MFLFFFLRVLHLIFFSLYDIHATEMFHRSEYRKTDFYSYCIKSNYEEFYLNFFFLIFFSYDRQLIPHTELECPTTRDALPMCVVSGRHMILDDWCFCPNSKSPALYSEYIKYIEVKYFCFCSIHKIKKVIHFD